MIYGHWFPDGMWKVCEVDEDGRDQGKTTRRLGDGRADGDDDHGPNGCERHGRAYRLAVSCARDHGLHLVPDSVLGWSETCRFGWSGAFQDLTEIGLRAENVRLRIALENFATSEECDCTYNNEGCDKSEPGYTICNYCAARVALGGKARCEG